MDTDTIVAFDALMEEALLALGDFAGDKWTDFNIHDPGVTILEYLAYALHDVSFRGNLPIQDLIASAVDQKGIRQFLPSSNRCLEAPIVTNNDIRALILDLHFVRNAWVENRNDGLIDIVVDVSAELSAKQRRWLRQAIREIMVRHRMIGTDVGKISFLKRQPIEIDLVLETLQTIPNLDQYLYRLFLEIDKYIMMLPNRRDFLDDDREINAAFGPKLAHGYHDETALIASERTNKLDIGGLINTIEDIEWSGAASIDIQVRRLNACRAGIQSGADKQPDFNVKVKSGLSELRLDPKCAYELDLDTSNLRVRQGSTVFSPDLMPVFEAVRRARDAKSLDKKLADVSNPATGQVRSDLSYYRSIQTEFPRLYALKKGELTKSATNGERAQAKQLQGFILLFEQFIANAIKSVQDSSALLGLLSPVLPEPGLIEQVEFHAGMENLNIKLQDRSRIFFEDNPQGYILAHSWRKYATSLFGETDEFFDIHELNTAIQERFLGWNYLICPEGDRSLLWLEEYLKKYFEQTKQTSDQDTDTASVRIESIPCALESGDQYQFVLRLKLLDCTLISTMLFNDEVIAKEEGARALSLAASRHRHRVSTHKGTNETSKYSYELLDTQSNVIARSSCTFDQVATIERDIDAWVKAGKNAHPQRKTFIIEHILLRPDQEMPVGKLPEACVNQISIALPARRHHWRATINKDRIISDLENRIPAHILTHIIWLDDEELEEFEELYCAWIDDYWGGGPALSQARNMLISLLERYGLSGWSSNDKSTSHYQSSEHDQAFGGVYDA